MRATTAPQFASQASRYWRAWFTGPARGLFAVWLLLMLAVPIAGWTAGLSAVRQIIVFTVLLQAALVFAILLPAWGWRRSLATFAFTVLATSAIEILGTQTGWLFGAYAYSETLQPQLGGVPLLIPLAWFMMLPAAWAVAGRLARKRWLFILLAGLAMASWDLLLDPQMVNWGLWQWKEAGGYFGIPWHNYLGWLGTAMLLTALLRPPPIPAAPLLLLYGLTWFLETFGLLLFWGLPGPAIVGGLVMGAFLAAALWQSP